MKKISKYYFTIVLFMKFTWYSNVYIYFRAALKSFVGDGEFSMVLFAIPVSATSVQFV
jgi:hypothetical protein